MAHPAIKQSQQAPDEVDNLIEEWREEATDLDVEAMAVVGRIIIISQKLQRRISALLRKYDLPYSDFDVLATLRRSGAPYELTPTELMQSVLLTSGAMTALLDRLQLKELIERGEGKFDKRVRTAKLTRKGKALVDKAARVRFDEAKEVIACFTKQERNNLAADLAYLNRWLDQLDFEQ